MTNGPSLEMLTAADFREIKGSRFRLTMESSEPGRDATFELELADVTEVARGAAGSSRKPFSLLFHGPLEPVLPQRIYRLDHDNLGVLETVHRPGRPRRAFRVRQAADGDPL